MDADRKLADINSLLISQGYSESARRVVWAVLERDDPPLRPLLRLVGSENHFLPLESSTPPPFPVPRLSNLPRQLFLFPVDDHPASE